MPSAAEHLLVSERGFPPEQHRLRIPLELGHPGWVFTHQVPLLLANTDEHSDFKQILKTARMGSAMYVPMLWRGKFLGQMIMAAQARHTFAQADLQILRAMAGMATATFVAAGGATELFAAVT
jgi:signal transduction protein with GAF and PtsI domain